MACVCVRMRAAAAMALVAGVAGVGGVVGVASGQMAVVSISPAINAQNVARGTAISVTFDRAVDRATVTPANFWAMGKLIGPVAGGAGGGGVISYSNGDRTVTLTPSRAFFAGEAVVVTMSRNLRGADGVALRSAGYSTTFLTGSTPGYRTFRHYATISNRDITGAQTRIYGGVACDLNRDGCCDITTINEVSADLRVMLNVCDGSGGLGAMLTPYTPVPFEASPNEVADFDRDGFIDIVTGSDGTDQIAIAMGRGDGTFRTPILINTGQNPRGFGVLDFDGDGDLDITVACANSNVVSRITNLGGGNFSAASNFAVAGGPYGMATGDMDGDGILDLAIGCRADQTCKVLRGNGNGTFTQASSRGMGGENWVLNLGDLNGDGRLDVAAGNSFSANGSILFGNGNGTMQQAIVYPNGGHTASSDLVDLDGDGDLDWVLSSFGAGTWYSYLNNGAGLFTPFEDFPAPSNPSCAVPVDIDGDGDMDLVLTDEIADVLVVMKNVCVADYDDGSGAGKPDGGVTIDDLLYYLSIFEAGNVLADVDDGSSTGQRDGGVTIDDLLYYLVRFEAGC